MSEVSKSDLTLIERYVFLGKTRFRIALSGTNIVFNVEASSEEEAFEKVLDMVRKMNIDKKTLEALRSKTRQRQ
ncbi:hypothetical protein ACSU1N_03085 [Thermogladius sp. 4427co]|uniref:hypothetical protein n=1 Tax=Thermogladius sp. 4427co TaxID=3450718 RepID=UPI003F7B1B83